MTFRPLRTRDWAETHRRASSFLDAEFADKPLCRFAHVLLGVIAEKNTGTD